MDIEAFTVMLTEPVSLNRFPVKSSTVAFIVGPVISWISLMQVPHMGIPVGLSQDTGRSNIGVEAISFNDTDMFYGRVGCKPVSINSQKTRLLLQGPDSQVHGLYGSLKYIYGIDLFNINAGNRITDGFPLNHCPQKLPVFFLHLLAVVQLLMVKILRQNHSSREDRARITAPAGFITAGFRHLILKRIVQHGAKI